MQNLISLQYTAKSVGETAKELKVSINKGLSTKEVQRRLEKYGKNEISEQDIRWWVIFLRQFKSAFIYLLLGASILAFLLGEIIDAGMILLFLLIGVVLGFYQEYRSERTLQLLQQYVTSYVKVFRNDEIDTVRPQEIVPGDIIVLETGDKIPADIRFIETDNVTVDETVLTGESVPIKKTSEALPQGVKELFQASNLGFSGTILVNGKAKGIVVAIGKQTALGKIARLTAGTKRISSFEKGINRFSKFILRLVVVTLILVFLANIVIKGENADIVHLVIFSIALAVSVIPEVLPVVITFSFARGARQLAKQKVIVKRLSAIQDLGAIEILAADKTGTLTENILKVAEIYPQTTSREVLLYANLATTSPQKKKLEPFDLALWNKLTKTEQSEIFEYKRLFDIPFDPTRRRNSVLIAAKNGRKELIVRGAPEVILDICKNISNEERQKIDKWIIQQGIQGRRLLAVGKKNVNNSSLNYSFDQIQALETKIDFLGIIAFVDPIKSTAFTAVKRARMLGVKIKIITGDSKEVAGAVAHQIGLISSPDQVITGQELETLSISKQREAVDAYSVFARVSPEQKYNIVQLLQEKHEVGFLGEGINDAPALKIAGVSLVVQSAADIAREAADIVLLRRDLKVIVDGIKEGRKTFANITKYIKATLSSNFGNFYAIAIASLFIPFLPMLPLQILLVNLLSDFPMMAIAADTVEQEELTSPKRYNVKDIIFIAIILGIVSTVFDFVFFGFFYRISPEVLQTNWFIGSILTEIVFLFSIRTKSVFFRSQKPPSLILWLTGGAFITTIILPYTAIGQKIFYFTPPTITHLFIILGIVLAYFIVSEIVKLFYYKGITHTIIGKAVDPKK